MNKVSKTFWLLPTICGVSLQSLIFVSCSSSAPIAIPAKLQAVQAQSQDGTGAQIVPVSEVQLSLSSNEIPEPIGRLLSSASNSSMFESSSSISFFSAGVSGVLSLNKKYDSLPTPAPVPAFASGKTYLPVNEGGTDFWMVGKAADGLDLIRPLSPLSSSVPDPALPEHMLASIKASAQPVGYSSDLLLLTSSDSLWIVKRDGSNLTVNEVSSPDAGASFISAGSISGGNSGYWFATAEKIWVVQPKGSDWSAREFKIKIVGLTGKLSKLNTVFELSGDQLKSKGPVIAQVGEQIGSAGVELSLGQSSPADNGNGQDTTPVGAMTFAEAQRQCSSCHATTSNNNAAKARLVGTENIATWMDPANKTRIVESIANDSMPLGVNLSLTDRQKLLNFANNPAP
ncbi:MAG: hypothetical protein RJB13_2140 [Pseudomonadota bacterium]